MLAFLGWWRARGRERTFANFLALFVLFTALTHAAIVVQPRLFFPVLTCLAPLAAMGAQAPLDFFRRRGNGRSRMRLMPAGSP